MPEFDANSLVQIVAAITMPVAVIAIIVHRIWLGMGIGVRAIQFVSASLLVPLILILALQGILEKNAVGALVGAFAGYLFSNIGKYDERNASKDDM